MTETSEARTDDLIAQLAAEVRPVRPLRPPLQRALFWLAIAVVVIGIVVAAVGIRPDFMEEMGETHYQLEWAGALLTGVLSAIAAFHVSLPDRPRAWALLPLPGLAFWLFSIGYGCMTDWVRLGPQGFAFGTSFFCFRSILLISLPLSVALLVMLRFAGSVRPVATIASAMLAASALSACGVSMFHGDEATLMVLVWHGGAVALLVGLGTLLNRRLFGLFAPRPAIAG
ncbi:MULTISPECIES: DUF1109 domain-containing protein [Inquilinus]|uniref:DUF1109 domain-containing protein n=1 Tax=Inquilinus ginsengisoli TaxID=363840 RepID=A0ABU1JVN2_9PROT|nr:DUF1109 domain-containing protein [Inquilinus ginsengisoli]MDR6292690.1 hypothetical protein [Inquilinus ginsengisoli]